MFGQRAQLEALLEGVQLPAKKRELLEYARQQDPELAQLLEGLPEREYRALDEVGEALVPAQSPPVPSHVALPREESGLPPGGDDYVNPDPTPGAVRPDGPPATKLPGA
ncbi:MAG: hypothetical protein QOH23_1384 [Gaiellaceae bacterium]|jgi:hypothetical protein|nr:hypothetical protein [Gaiellaceae bacterium]